MKYISFLFFFMVFRCSYEVWAWLLSWFPFFTPDPVRGVIFHHHPGFMPKLPLGGSLMPPSPSHRHLPSHLLYPGFPGGWPGFWSLLQNNGHDQSQQFLKKKPRATSLIYWKIILIHYTVFQGAFKRTLPKNLLRPAGQTPCLGKVKSMVWTFSGSDAAGLLVLRPGLFPAIILK